MTEAAARGVTFCFRPGQLASGVSHDSLFEGHTVEHAVLHLCCAGEGMHIRWFNYNHFTNRMDK